MAVKFSELPAASSAQTTDVFAIADDGTSRRLTAAQLLTLVQSENPMLGTSTLPPNNDLDDVTESGIYHTDASTLNAPGSNRMVLHMQRGSDRGAQFAIAAAATEQLEIQFRELSGNGWSSWTVLVDGAEIPDARLSNNVPLRDAASNDFDGDASFAGDVAIGNTNPSTKLNLEGAGASLAGVTAQLEISSEQGNTSADAGGGVVFSSSGDSRHAAIRGARENTDSLPGYLAFYTRPSGGGLAEVARFDRDGSFGIGTASPSEALDVDGNIQLSGSISMTTSGALLIGSGHGASTDTNSTAIGEGAQALSSSVTALGRNAGNNSSGDDVTALGAFCAANNTGLDLTAVGRGASFDNTGTSVTTVGHSAGQVNGGDNLTAIGVDAARDNTGDDCVMLGYQAGRDNTTANQFIVEQRNVNTTPLIQGDFSSGDVEIPGIFMADLLQVTDYTVSTLPSGAEAQIAYVSDGRKNGEGAGSGSGVAVFYDGSNWIAMDSGQTVAA